MTKRSYHTLTPDEIEHPIKEYLSGSILTVIASEFGASYQAVRRHLILRGVRIRKSHESRRIQQSLVWKITMPASTFPIDAIDTLLNMVRGTLPFNLVAAIKAALAIAEYATSLFDANALPMSATPELSLEKALHMVKEQHQAHVATASSINTSLLSYILKLAFEWISQHFQS